MYMMKAAVKLLMSEVFPISMIISTYMNVTFLCLYINLYECNLPKSPWFAVYILFTFDNSGGSTGERGGLTYP